MASTFQGDLDDLRALGHSALSLVNVAILLALVAVLFASGNAVAALIQQGFGLLAWLVGNTVAPVQQGPAVVLSSAYGPAGSYATTGGSGGAYAGAVQSDVGAIQAGMAAGVAGPDPTAPTGSTGQGNPFTPADPWDSTHLYEILGPDGTPMGRQYGNNPALLPHGYSVGSQIISPSGQPAGGGPGGDQGAAGQGY